jgi:hypothetical protein
MEFTSKKEEEEEIVQQMPIVNKRETLIISTIFLIYLVNLNNDWQIKRTGNLSTEDKYYYRFLTNFPFV